MYNYVASAQKATNVTHVCTGNFTAPTDHNLIVCKATRLQFHLLTSEGTVEQFDLGVYGRVAACQLYRPSGEKVDLLFVLTERCQFFVLGYDRERGEAVTKATGNIADYARRKNDDKKIAIIDPKCRLVGLHIYQGLFKVIPIDSKGGLKDAYDVRLDENDVIDIQFLHGFSNPTICVLYGDNKGCTHIRTYEINMKNKDLSPGPWSQPNVDPETNKLIAIPEPLGGVLVLGLESISYHSGKSGVSKTGGPNTVTIPVRFGEISACCKVDGNGTRWLLGDSWGGLHVLVLQESKTMPPVSTAQASSSTPDPSSAGTSYVSDLSLEYLGETSLASCMSYLDNGYVYVGSSYGDSQLIHLSPEKDPTTESYVTIIETKTNHLGPISDFCVVDLERQGQGQVVTCSGAYKDGNLTLISMDPGSYTPKIGTLRVVRNGIGIDQLATVELAGIKAMWALRKSMDAKYDSYLVQSFINETRVLGFEGDELSETELAGFSAQEPTLFTCNMEGDLLIQITPSEARLVDCSSLEHVYSWRPEDGSSIKVGTANAKRVLVALGGGRLVLLKLEGRELGQTSTCTMDREVACLALEVKSDMSSVDGDGDVEMEMAGQDQNQEAIDVAAVGLWTDVSVRLLSLPLLHELEKHFLGGETIPRSLLFADLEQTNYLLIGLGDGVLLTFKLVHEVKEGNAVASLTAKKKVSLGTQPVSLALFSIKNVTNVFAASDRPTVIYSGGGKLSFSNVNLQDVPVMSAFNCEAFPDSLALASKEELLLGTINEIQKLHIRTIRLNERPDRICHVPSKHVFALCTTRSGPENADASINRKDGIETEPGKDDSLANFESSFLRLVDDQSFEILDSFELDELEISLSIALCRFTNAEIPQSSSGPDMARNQGARAVEDYIVVGTAYCVDSESEPSRGRILVFSVSESESGTGKGSSGGKKLSLVTERVTRGAVYSLHYFNGKLLAGIQSKVQLFSFTSKDQSTFELQPEASNTRHIAVLFIESQGDFILVGDLFKSIILLTYNPTDGTLKEIARDYNGKWMTAIEMFSDERFIGAETNGNMFCACKNNDALTDEAIKTLNITGQYHLGDFINRFRKGSLVMTSARSDEIAATSLSSTENKLDFAITPTLLFGTVDGLLGVVAPLTLGQYKILLALQKALSEVIHGVGGLTHAEWRSYLNDRKPKQDPAFGFIDGDLIEAFLDLKRQDMERVLSIYNRQASEQDTAKAKDPITSATASSSQATASSSKTAEQPNDASTATSKLESGRDLVELKLDDLIRVVEDLQRIH